RSDYSTSTMPSVIDTPQDRAQLERHRRAAGGEAALAELDTQAELASRDGCPDEETGAMGQGYSSVEERDAKIRADADRRSSPEGSAGHGFAKTESDSTARRVKSLEADLPKSRRTATTRDSDELGAAAGAVRGVEARQRRPGGSCSNQSSSDATKLLASLHLVHDDTPRTRVIAKLDRLRLTVATPEARSLEQQAGEAQAGGWHRPGGSGQPGGLRPSACSRRRTRCGASTRTVWTQVRRLTDSLQKLQSSSNETRDALTAEIAERHELAAATLEEKFNEAMSTANQRFEAIRQLKEELKIANQRSTESQERARRSEAEAQQSQRQLEERGRELEAVRLRRAGANSSQREGQWRAERAELMDKCQRLGADAERMAEELAERQAAQERLHSQVAELRGAVSQRQQLLAADGAAAGHQPGGIGRTARTAGQTGGGGRAAAAGSGPDQEAVPASAEELSRLESKVQAAAASGQSEREQLAEETRRREAELARSAQEAARQQEARSRLEERCAGLEKQAEAASKSAKAAKAESARLEAELQRAKRREKRAEELRVQTKRLQEASRGQQQELSSRAGELEAARRQISSREEQLAGTRAELESLAADNRELSQRLMQRDDLLARLSGETQKLKNKYQDRVQEMTKQSDTIKRLQEALAQSQLEVEEVKRRSEEEVSAVLLYRFVDN
uniref:Myosin_tail_1 domain-containing protein n=1 Tax=Macrostomum lignano TaxID=282301 RepID=A0A1I8FAQ3_9PLAT